MFGFFFWFIESIYFFIPCNLFLHQSHLKSLPPVKINLMHNAKNVIFHYWNCSKTPQTLVSNFVRVENATLGGFFQRNSFRRFLNLFSPGSIASLLQQDYPDITKEMETFRWILFLTFVTLSPEAGALRRFKGQTLF